MAEKNYFEKLNDINVNGKTEQKGELTYLSWVWAWGEIKKRYPDAAYTIYENDKGWNYHTDGKTAWVKTGVTINGIEHIEYLPVMDNKNNSIPLEKVTSMDVNKAIQRSTTKAIARHGLGLYIYAGEDLPEVEAKEKVEGYSVEVSGPAYPDRAVMLELVKKHNPAGSAAEKGVLAYYKIDSLDQLTDAALMAAYNKYEGKR